MTTLHTSVPQEKIWPGEPLTAAVALVPVGAELAAYTYLAVEPYRGKALVVFKPPAHAAVKDVERAVRVAADFARDVYVVAGPAVSSVIPPRANVHYEPDEAHAIVGAAQFLTPGEHLVVLWPVDEDEAGPWGHLRRAATWRASAQDPEGDFAGCPQLTKALEYA